MSSREKMLAAIAKNKPEPTTLPALDGLGMNIANVAQKFTDIAVGIGSKVFPVKGYDEVQEILQEQFGSDKRVLTTIPELQTLSKEVDLASPDPHSFENVELAVMNGQLAVAENSAIWVTEGMIGQRVLPFICQHLSLIIKKSSILPDMHEAYKKIGDAEYGYGVFIAGPSKTADIEQSLVLGAHGPRSLWVFIMED